MENAAKNRQSQDENVTGIELATRWGLIALAVLAAIGGLLRVFGPSKITPELDQTTLLYLAVAAGLLLLRQVKTFSMGQLKLEMIEKIQERQDRQEENLDLINLVLPLLLPSSQIRHITKLYKRSTNGYIGSHPTRTELRRLASIGLLARKTGRHIAEMKDGVEFDLAELVELTELGRRWAKRIEEIEEAGAAE